MQDPPAKDSQGGGDEAMAAGQRSCLDIFLGLACRGLGFRVWDLGFRFSFPKIRGTQYRHQYFMILITRTPEKVSLILGIPYIYLDLATKIGRFWKGSFAV